MNKKIFFVQDAHYDLSVDKNNDNTTYKLKMSHSESIPAYSQGKTKMKIVDDGNGVVVNNVRYDYDMFEALYILMEAIAEIDNSLIRKNEFFFKNNDK